MSHAKRTRLIVSELGVIYTDESYFVKMVVFILEPDSDPGQ